MSKKRSLKRWFGGRNSRSPPTERRERSPLATEMPSNLHEVLMFRKRQRSLAPRQLLPARRDAANYGAMHRYSRNVRRPADRHQRASVGVAQFFECRGTLMQPPFVDCFHVEAPVAADFEPRQLSLLEQPINRRAMDPQIIG